MCAVWIAALGSVKVCVVVCARHGVFPRDRWSCVLPRWQFNVNVNVNERSHSSHPISAHSLQPLPCNVQNRASVNCFDGWRLAAADAATLCGLQLAAIYGDELQPVCVDLFH